MADKTLHHKGYQGSIEVSVEDDCLHGRILFIEDLIIYEGETVADLKTNFAASVERYLDDCAACDKLPNRPYSGVFQLRVAPELHRCAVEAARREDVKLNDLVTKAIRRYVDQLGTLHVSHHNEVKVTLFNEDACEQGWTAGAAAPAKWASTSSTAN